MGTAKYDKAVADFALNGKGLFSTTRPIAQRKTPTTCVAGVISIAMKMARRD